MAKDALAGTFIPLTVFDSVTQVRKWACMRSNKDKNFQIIPVVHLCRTSSVAE